MERTSFGKTSTPLETGQEKLEHVKILMRHWVFCFPLIVRFCRRNCVCNIWFLNKFSLLMFHEWIFGKDVLLICYGKSGGIFICIHIWQKGLNILWDQVVFLFYDVLCMNGVSKNFFKYSFFLFNKVHDDDVAARVSQKRGQGGRVYFQTDFFCCTSLFLSKVFLAWRPWPFSRATVTDDGGGCSFHVLPKIKIFFLSIRQVILSKGQIDCYICMYNKHQCSHKSIKNCRRCNNLYQIWFMCNITKCLCYL